MNDVADKITMLELAIGKLRKLSSASPQRKQEDRDKAGHEQSELAFEMAQVALALLGGALIDLNRIASALEEIEMNTRRNA